MDVCMPLGHSRKKMAGKNTYYFLLSFNSETYLLHRSANTNKQQRTKSLSNYTFDMTIFACNYINTWLSILNYILSCYKIFCFFINFRNDYWTWHPLDLTFCHSSQQLRHISSLYWTSFTCMLLMGLCYITIFYALLRITLQKVANLC